MSFNGSGTFNLAAGNPVVTGTTISSTTHNNTMSDIATGLSTCVTKDGQTTITANIPMATFKITGLGDATALQDAITAKQVQNSTTITLSSVAGTNTVTGSATPTPGAYAAGQTFSLIPANTNTGATTLNVSSLGAKNVFWNGAACVGGELRQNIPAKVIYDGTQFHVISNGFNAPFLDTHPIVEGSADSTKKVAIEVDGLTTATTRTWTARDADFQIGTATAAEMEAASATNVPVTPGILARHPHVPKVGCRVDQGTGTATLVAGSFGVTSVTDGATGVFTLNFSTNFADTNYIVMANNGLANRKPLSITKNVGSLVVNVETITTGVLLDTNDNNLVIWGDQ